MHKKQAECNISIKANMWSHAVLLAINVWAIKPATTSITMFLYFQGHVNLNNHSYIWAKRNFNFTTFQSKVAFLLQFTILTFIFTFCGMVLIAIFGCCYCYFVCFSLVELSVLSPIFLPLRLTQGFISIHILIVWSSHYYGIRVAKTLTTEYL